MKDSKLYSIFTSTCPVCHTGKMYKKPNPYVFSETLKMNDRCPHCDTKFKIEPSFFYGAMYVSYGVGVAIAIAAFILAFFVFGLDRLQTFFVIMITLLVSFPLILRLSRNIWINMFFTYDPEKAN
ncbi:DUF983 domain-containing protein [Cochleicola gelatinilyticus]|uniref:DUF983 domain-containing protein n=1 Tax=Cochleicola gelatinilyticus TaxID=1763537 RepID=A0A167IKV5_9FLAO|nr:DUF983 domain-containing protein [Cochleicola gelatinilyticus]OAB79767.1 hypothetical protein ULVI_03205 [Cochleicola gelatinilyticus]